MLGADLVAFPEMPLGLAGGRRVISTSSSSSSEVSDKGRPFGSPNAARNDAAAEGAGGGRAAAAVTMGVRGEGKRSRRFGVARGSGAGHGWPFHRLLLLPAAAACPFSGAYMSSCVLAVVGNWTIPTRESIPGCYSCQCTRVSSRRQRCQEKVSSHAYTQRSCKASSLL